MTPAPRLLVVGSGSAGGAAARRCREAGWSVAVADERPPGGTCAQRGCIPKKVLTAGAAAADASRRWRGGGLDAAAAIVWPDLRRFQDTFTEPVPGATEDSFRKQGIELLRGHARFVGPQALRVGETVHEADWFLIAAGARPAPIPIEGREHLLSSTRFLELERLPERILFVGGGYIGFEFAHVAARAGARVTLLHRGRRALPGFDPVLVERLCEGTRAIGVSVLLDHDVLRVVPEGVAYRVVARNGEREKVFVADAVVHGAGRVPNLDGLDPERGEIALDEGGGPLLDEHLQSRSNPRVYFAGDAGGAGPALSPVAAAQGNLVAENLLQGNHRVWDGSGVPSVLYTTPPLARVGLLESEAAARGLAFRTASEITPDWFSARHVHQPHAGHRTLIEERTERILGAHLLGPHAEEVVNIFAVAIQCGITADRLREVVYAFPTEGSDVPSMIPGRPRGRDRRYHP